MARFLLFALWPVRTRFLLREEHWKNKKHVAIRTSRWYWLAGCFFIITTKLWSLILFSFQFFTRLGSVFAEEVGDIAIGKI